MIRIDPLILSQAAEAVAAVVASATTSDGLRITWRLSPREIEKALCAMLTGLAPGQGPASVLPADMLVL